MIVIVAVATAVATAVAIAVAIDVTIIVAIAIAIAIAVTIIPSARDRNPFQSQPILGKLNIKMRDHPRPHATNWHRSRHHDDMYNVYGIEY